MLSRNIYSKRTIGSTHFRYYILFENISQKGFVNSLLFKFTMYLLISANHTYDGLIKAQQKPVHQVKHTVHGSHLTQDSIKKKIMAPIPIQSVITILFKYFLVRGMAYYYHSRPEN